MTVDGEVEGRRKKEEKKRKVVQKVEEDSESEDRGEWEKVGSSAVSWVLGGFEGGWVGMGG